MSLRLRLQHLTAGIVLCLLVSVGIVCDGDVRVGEERVVNLVDVVSCERIADVRVGTEGQVKEVM